MFQENCGWGQKGDLEDKGRQQIRKTIEKKPLLISATNYQSQSMKCNHIFSKCKGTVGLRLLNNSNNYKFYLQSLDITALIAKLFKLFFLTTSTS